ncbi:MAG: hypothetical protein CHKLHMKO_00242 [Candidatus Argoarchaeum ethanivorans]|uniref:Dockerin domain-containing protein n=1 Tax=Candidatus Argoarchaeum ethanivorans TaxID=2608793 RepID=A0A811T4P7_9EURY|nr:MAG: hypothetical protein CHKLHMKO_00242 [Candidatus Argoarchaeum ethanivorans]
MGKNGTVFDLEIVAINESFSMSCSGDTRITGTLHNINRSDDSAFEVCLVNVTQYSGDGGVLFSDATKILTNAPIRLCAMCGDLNSDSEITSTDAAIVLEIAVGSRPCDPETLAIADVSGDGRVSSLDALMILQNCTTSLCRDK